MCEKGKLKGGDVCPAMDFQSAMETFAEAWVAANTQTPLTTSTSMTAAETAEAQALALTRSSEAVSSSHSHQHNVVSDKDGGVEGESSRTVTNLLPRCSSAPESFHPKPILVRPVCNTAKSIPVHCIVEQVPSRQRCDSSGSGEFLQTTVELDSYAIIPSGTPFCELVKTALMKLGYSSSDIIGAKGAIQIKNWKPLAFETITEDSTATVVEILGELTTVATLRIRLYSRPKISSANDVKEKLLQLLLTQSQSLLISAGCPIDEGLLTLISKGGNQCRIPEDVRRRFDKWYVQQVHYHRRLLDASSIAAAATTSNNSATITGGTSSGSSVDNGYVVGGGGGGGGGVRGFVLAGSSNSNINSGESVDLSTAVNGGGIEDSSAAAATAAAHRTRMRTSFDPEMELPKLHCWFNENQHPTRLQIQQYVRELNSLESRKGRKPLDVNNVVYWFKNARAAYKRAELRQSNGSHSPVHDSASNDHQAAAAAASPPVDDDRRFRLLMACAAAAEGGGGGRKSKFTTASLLTTVGGMPSEAMDLSTTHRDSVANGHWKTPPQNVKEEDDDDDEEEDEDDEEESSGAVKREPVERTLGSVSTDDNDDDDDEEEEEDDEEEDVDEVLRSTPLQGSAVEALSEKSSDHRKILRANSSSSALLPYTGGGDRFSPQSSSSSRGGGGGNMAASHHHHHHTSTAVLYMAGFVPSSVAAAVLDERRKRNRTFIDPVTEVPRLEQWFAFNTHPPHSLILKYTDELNQMPYRQKFPKLEPKNVQFWFKNRRAKCKRLRLSVNLVTSAAASSSSAPSATVTGAASW